jgi:hypothetical protein
MFEPANDLERLLTAAARDPEARPDFAAAVLAGDVYACPDATAEEPGYRLVMLEDDTLAVALFTSPGRVAAIFDDAPAVERCNGRDLLTRLRAGFVSVNPGSDYGVVWSPDNLAGLIDGVVTETVETPTKILLGHPAERPEALIAALARELGALGQVKAAYLLLAHRADKPEPSWLLGVDQDGDWNEVRAAIGRAVAGDILKGRALDAQPLSRSALAQDLRGGIPILAPKRRGFLSFFR